MADSLFIKEVILRVWQIFHLPYIILFNHSLIMNRQLFLIHLTIKRLLSRLMLKVNIILPRFKQLLICRRPDIHFLFSSCLGNLLFPMVWTLPDIVYYLGRQISFCLVVLLHYLCVNEWLLCVEILLSFILSVELLLSLLEYLLVDLVYLLADSLWWEKFIVHQTLV